MDINYLSCPECGALVHPTDEALHRAWHVKASRPAKPATIDPRLLDRNSH